MTLNLTFISFNVGGEGDTLRLLKLLGRTDEPAAAWYTQKADEAVSSKGEIYGQTPNIICLQEFYGGNVEKRGLRQKIENAGYTICGQDGGRGDLAVAFKTDKFILGESGDTHNNSGAFYALLTERRSGKTICAVSDHVRGFDAPVQKCYTRLLRQQNVDYDPVNKKPWDEKIARATKKSFTAPGDESVGKTLKFLETVSADGIVYCLDANATDTYVDKKALDQSDELLTQVHPKRLRKFSDAKYLRDTTDTEPTILEHCLRRKDLDKEAGGAYTNEETLLLYPQPEIRVKYDHIFTKAAEGYEVSIKSKAIGPQPDQFAHLLSDHRPVYATIQLKDNRRMIWKALSATIAYAKAFFSWIRSFVAYATSRLRKPANMDLSLFNAYFKEASPSYNFLKAHGKTSLGLLLAAKVTPQDLETYFGLLGSSLDKVDPVQQKFSPEEICEYFIEWCTLKTLDPDNFKIGFKMFQDMPQQIISKLKEKFQELLRKPNPNAAEKNCQDYLKRHMQDSSLLKDIRVRKVS